MERETLLSDLLARTCDPTRLVADLSTFAGRCAMPTTWLEAKHVASILRKGACEKVPGTISSEKVPGEIS
jgi:hypothetical protein